MRRKYLVIAVLVWVLLIVMGLYFYNKPHSSMASIKPDYSLEATELYKQFQQDEAVANKKYLDKVIVVKGMVAEVQQSGTNATVELRGESSLGGVNCSFMNMKPNTQFTSKGSFLTIKGKCSGFLMDVNLVDCVVEK